MSAGAEEPADDYRLFSGIWAPRENGPGQELRSLLYFDAAHIETPEPHKRQTKLWMMESERVLQSVSVSYALFETRYDCANRRFSIRTVQIFDKNDVRRFYEKKPDPWHDIALGSYHDTVFGFVCEGTGEFIKVPADMPLREHASWTFEQLHEHSKQRRNSSPSTE